MRWNRTLRSVRLHSPVAQPRIGHGQAVLHRQGGSVLLPGFFGRPAGRGSQSAADGYSDVEPGVSRGERLMACFRNRSPDGSRGPKGRAHSTLLLGAVAASGLLTSGSTYYRAFPHDPTLPSDSSSGVVSGSSPVTVAGAMPDSHRLPLNATVRPSSVTASSAGHVKETTPAERGSRLRCAVSLAHAAECRERSTARRRSRARRPRPSRRRRPGRSSSRRS